MFDETGSDMAATGANFVASWILGSVYGLHNRLEGGRFSVCRFPPESGLPGGIYGGLKRTIRSCLERTIASPRQSLNYSTSIRNASRSHPIRKAVAQFLFRSWNGMTMVWLSNIFKVCYRWYKFIFRDEGIAFCFQLIAAYCTHG